MSTATPNRSPSNILLILSFGILVASMGYRIMSTDASLRDAVGSLERQSLLLSERSAMVDGFIGLVNERGVNLRSVAGVDVTSGELTEGLSRQHTVAYVFSTTCPFSVDNISSLYEAMGEHLQFVGIVPDEATRRVAAFARGNEVPFTIITEVPPVHLSWVPTKNVPVTAVVSEDGLLQGVWLGALDEGRLEEVKRVAYGLVEG